MCRGSGNGADKTIERAATVTRQDEKVTTGLSRDWVRVAGTKWDVM